MHPDLLVIDLELPGIDGMTLLRRIQAAGPSPEVIVMGRLMSDYAVDTLLNMKVAYLVRKPCNVQAVAEHAMELLRYHAQKESPVQAAVRDILMDLGICVHQAGGKYLLRAVILMAQNPSQYITKELYPAAGKAYGKSGQVVERGIRNAIEKAWLGCDPKAWSECFGTDENGRPMKPQNREFILKMVELLRRKL